MNKYSNYKFGKYSDEPIRFNSYGITKFTPVEEEKELNNKIEIPFVLLSILVIVVVVLNFFPIVY